MAERKPWPRISAILLAAGQSRRMAGPNKLLLPLHGLTVLEHQLELLAQLPFLERIVVLGHQAERIQPLLAAHPFRVVLNASFESGMTSSIQAGVAAAAHDAEGFLICLADQISLSPEPLTGLIDHFARHRGAPAIVRPSWQGRFGNPVLFHAAFRDALLAVPEADGCRSLLARHPAAVRLFPSQHGGFYADLDTPGDYAALAEDPAP